MLTNTPAFSSYSVDDIEKAEAFYGGTFGIKTARTPEGLELHLAQDVMIFLYPKPNHVPAEFTVLNFKIEDIETAAKALTDAGITLEKYDGMPQDEQGIMWGRKMNRGPNQAWFKDPAGNILSMVQ